MDFWYNLVKNTLGTYVTLFVHPVHITGREKLPTGPKIGGGQPYPHHRYVCATQSLP
jgi:hypothetical protein